MTDPRKTLFKDVIFSKKPYAIDLLPHPDSVPNVDNLTMSDIQDSINLTDRHLLVGFSLPNAFSLENPIHFQWDAAVRNGPTRFYGRIGQLKVKGKLYRNTYLLEVDVLSAQESFRGNTFGSHAYASYGQAATLMSSRIVYALQAQVGQVISSWPILYWVLSTDPQNQIHRQFSLILGDKEGEES